VRKLEPLSVRAILGLLAASGEWLMHRLPGSGDPLPGDLVTAMWVGAVDPRLVDLTGPYSGSETDPATGPVRAYLRTIRDCHDIALQLHGAFHSYAESGLRLVDYVMPNAAYRTWRRTCYSRLAALTSSFAMHEADAKLEEQVGASGEQYTSHIVERLLAAGKLDELWGPAVPREAYDPKAVSSLSELGVNKIRWIIEQAVANFKTWRATHTDYRRPIESFAEPSPPWFLGVLQKRLNNPQCSVHAEPIFQGMARE
jgi:hypothetical protein